MSSLAPSSPERKLIDAARAGTSADFSSDDQTANNPATGMTWGAERTIRADIIYALAVGSNPSWPIHCRGVRLKGARIIGELDFEAAELCRPLTLTRCYIEKPINFALASAHSITLTGSHVISINANGLRTRYDLSLGGGFTAKAGIALQGGHIRGLLQCGGGVFENAAGAALNADRLAVDGSIYLRNGFKSTGAVRLSGANIGRNLECDGGTFENPGQRVLDAEGVTVGGGIYLRKRFKALGEVRMLRASIGGSLDCEEGTFENPGQRVLDTEGVTVAGSIYLRNGFKALGEVRLVAAKIRSALECSKGTFSNPGNTVLDARRVDIGGPLDFTSLTEPPAGTIDLGFAKSGQLADDLTSWPTSGSLNLHGFVYQSLSRNAPTDAKQRSRWLDRQSKDRFTPQPYEQLTHVLRQMGHERDAQAIAIAKQAALRKSGQLAVMGRLWDLLLAITTRYGHRPALIILWIAPLVLFGALVFAQAYRSCLMAPSKEQLYIDS